MNETASKEASKQLTELEYERLEKSRLLQEFRAKEMEILKLQERHLSDRKTVLEMSIRNLSLERLEIERERQKVGASLEAEKEGHREILAGIRSRLDLKGEFGYNPDTLEIVQDE